MRYTINIIKEVLFLLILLAVPFAGKSQTVSTPQILTGVVRNASGPFVGVTVTVVNENNRTLTGVSTTSSGEYYLRVNPGQNLKIQFAFLGYKTQTVPYQGQKTIDIMLEPDQINVKTVTVTAQGVQKNDMGIPESFTGSAISKVDMADLEGIPATSAADALYGTMAGVDIVASSGDPGAKSSIRIRGTGSLNANNEPLFVVDGIPYEPPGNTEDFNYNTADENDFGALLNITPTDIESIEVLQDAMAVLTWGPKGANGVLVIKTKSGTPGKTRFRISERFDYNWEPKKIPLLNGKQYVTLMQDAMWNRMGDVGYSAGEMENLLDYPEINYDPSYQYFDEYSVDTDWLDLVRQNAFTNEIGFSMEGGGDRARYKFSLTNTDNRGTTKGTYHNRLTARLKIDYNFSDKFVITSSIDYTQNKKDETMPYSGSSNPRSIAEIKMPNMSPYVLDDNGNVTDEYFVPVSTSTYKPFQGEYPSMYNPLAMVEESTNKLVQSTVNFVVNMRYDILDNLTYRNDISLRLGSSNRRTFLSALATGVASSDSDFNRADETKSDNMYIYVNNQLTYNKFFDAQKKTSLYVATKFNFEQSSSTSYGEAVSGLADVSMSDPVTGGLIRELKSGTSISRSVMSSTSATFTFKERYSVTAGWSLGGSTKLGPKARWQGFPTVSGVWHFGEENFLRSAKWLEEGRLSVSWGKSGRGPSSDFAYIGTFGTVADYMGNAAIAPQSIQADNLKMEINRQLNVQLELSYLKYFYTKIAYYDKKDTDLLQANAPVPWSTGFSTISYYNSGASANRGLNVEFNFKDLFERNKDWKLTGGFTLSMNRNRIIELPSNKIDNEYTFGNGNYAKAITLNDPIGSVYGYKYEGVYQTYDDIIARDAKGNIIRDMLGNPVYTSINGVQLHPGDAKYTDMNHDGVIDQYDMVYLGNSQPTFFSGQNISLRYKQLQLDVRGYLRVGNKIVNRARINTENMRGSNNQSTAVLRRWRHEGDNTDIPRALYNRGYNYLGSDRFVDDGDYFRIKQLTLTYYLGDKLGKKLGLTPNSTRLYVTGYDLFTITGYSGQNPEVDAGGGMFPIAEDNSKTPRPIKISVGLSIDF